MVTEVCCLKGTICQPIVAARWLAVGAVAGWHSPSRNTGQGVCCHGEPKGLKPGGEGKPTFRNRFERLGKGSERAYSHGGKTRNQTIVARAG